ncbi:hypothetical protein C8Q75DRAFT_806772 [Abortiporus biennis]|nr:hypothetical protein C8Q75DRAFT_806772 [Abortiporus biennis]
MSDSDPTTPSSSDSPSQSRRPIFQAETTGSKWGDLKEAFKRLSWDDVEKINEIPCARNSLLSGIASGAGIGFIRGMSAGPFVASNWAVGTFMLISLGTWTICQKGRYDERRRIQHVVEQIPKRVAKTVEGTDSTTTGSSQ